MSTDNAAQPLQQLREQISALDSSMLELLAQRQQLARAVAASKIDSQLPLRDIAREEKLLSQHVQKAQQLGLHPRYVTKIFHAVIEESLRAQRATLHPLPNTARVAVLGGQGSYSALAAEAWFANVAELELKPGRQFRDVVHLLRSGDSDYAVLPIENSITGAISAVYDLLRDGDLYVVGEHYLPIKHSLLAKPGVGINQIQNVLGHPQALAQCDDFLQRNRLALSYCDSTAAALKQVASAEAPLAVIGSEAVAAEYGLVVLADAIANTADNETRFVVLSRTLQSVPAPVASKTSLMFCTWQRPGALADALLVFRDRAINLTRIESRPMPGEPWQAMFFLDCEGNIESETLQEAVQALSRCTRVLRVLGCYPSERLPPAQVPVTVLAQSETESRTENSSPVSDPTSSIGLAVAAPAKKPAKAGKGWKLASREHKPDDTIVEVGGVRIGDDFIVMAGPCSIESVEQIESCAAWAAQHGARILRGGCFKPRTSPYAFQGLGLPGLDMMKQAGDRHGLPIITEVMSIEDIEPVARQSDILQIGARNMQNFSLLKELGKTHRPVMLKRGLMNSIDEWLQAAEYILAGGNQQVILCERGIRTFETATRSTLDLSAVPVLRELTHLPIIVDPSHAAGRRDLVPALAQAAKAVGAHGIIVEFHPEPEKALSDGPQALYFEQFAGMMQRLYQ
ncbi:3-deoxy-7-phosphoheptulonate synthase [Permianibacter sp. IMCC34836]|uniref:3-deoxy-7-phosphoheptulonate synthase n=1 Tax=Permianibacter fluminis TaxID=2738515 RepID=UPI00155265BA|nr:3-deoxy-7-phosphoheptulonate synthase [Permianibacter fluminis]NQD36589.1 3-deoxy-7-phosphoheptulonate synthase [Permianibacter fluminis]